VTAGLEWEEPLAKDYLIKKTVAAAVPGLRPGMPWGLQVPVPLAAMPLHTLAVKGDVGAMRTPVALMDWEPWDWWVSWRRGHNRLLGRVNPGSF
jgi:hypothetical protein